MKKYVSLFSLVAAICIECKAQSFCFSQNSTDTIWPKVFCDTIRVTNGISFSTDGKTLYTSRFIERGKKDIKIFEHRWNGNKYNSPLVVPFCKGNEDYHPVVSPDGNRIFFNSKRPVPGTDTLNKKVHIWYAEKNGNNWGKAKYPGEVNVAGFHNSYPSVTRTGALYFNSDRPGGKGGMDFYRCAFKNGKYRKAVNISAINSADAENDLVVDPDERFIIFNRAINATGEVDMWITFRKGNNWTAPRKLDEINQEKIMELTPALSVDGRYFLYERRGIVMYMPMDKLLRQNEKKYLR